MNGNHFDIHDLKREYEKGRKQGALEELKELYKSVSVFHVENSIELKLIQKRIKELEGGLKWV